MLYRVSVYDKVDLSPQFLHMKRFEQKRVQYKQILFTLQWRIDPMSNHAYV